MAEAPRYKSHQIKYIFKGSPGFNSMLGELVAAGQDGNVSLLDVSVPYCYWFVKILLPICYSIVTV